MKKFSIRLGVYLLSLVLVFPSTLQMASAAMISTHDMLTMPGMGEGVSTLQRERLRSEVIQILNDYGVPYSDAVERANALTAQELARIQSRIDSLPAGQSALSVIGIVFVVLILLEIVGVINIFNKL